MPAHTMLRVAVPVLVLALASPARADMITDWNAKAEAIAVEKRMQPPPNARIMAILHVAMFDAVNAIERRSREIKQEDTPC